MVAGIVGVLLGSIYERHRTLHGVFLARCRELTAELADRDNQIDDLERRLERARGGSNAAPSSSVEPWELDRHRWIEQQTAAVFARAEETLNVIEAQLEETMRRSDGLLRRLSQQSDAQVVEITRLRATAETAREALSQLEEFSSVRPKEQTGRSG